VGKSPTNALDRVPTLKQTLWLGIASFTVALCPLLTLRFGRPTSWLGEFAFLLCACVSFFASPGLTVALCIDILRRKADAATFAAFGLSLAAVAAMGLFVYLRFQAMTDIE